MFHCGLSLKLWTYSNQWETPLWTMLESARHHCCVEGVLLHLSYIRCAMDNLICLSFNWLGRFLPSVEHGIKPEYVGTTGQSDRFFCRSRTCPTSLHQKASPTSCNGSALLSSYRWVIPTSVNSPTYCSECCSLPCKNNSESQWEGKICVRYSKSPLLQTSHCRCLSISHPQR